MSNRNFFKGSQKRTDSQSEFQRDSFQVSNSKNYNFLQDDFTENMQSNLPSPIMKMKF